MSKPDKQHLRICVLAFMFAPFVGGAEIQAEKHARQMLALGHDVLIITLRHYRHWKLLEIHNGLPVVRIGGLYRRNGRLNIGRSGRLLLDLAVFWKLWQLRQHYDVIHSMQLSSMGAVATLVGQLTGKPVVLSIQSAGPDQQQERLLSTLGARLMADMLADRFDDHFLKVATRDWTPGDIELLVQSVPLIGRLWLQFYRQSNAFYQVLSNRCYSYLINNGFKPEQIVRISNGVDTEQFRPASTPPARFERLITCVARLEYPKGVDVLLHAWGRMMHETPAWPEQVQPRLRIVGEGIFRPHLERIIAELHIQESVELPGRRLDIVELLQQSWGFVLPSRWEGMPNALLEAMACGLPCVATRVSGSEDIIQHEINGLLVEPEQPAEMANALRRIIEDRALRLRLGQAARHTIVSEYRIEAVAERCLQLYHHLLSQQVHVVPLALQETRE
jgi:glycosyltransferase involved in cell wall biosynthesis